MSESRIFQNRIMSLAPKWGNDISLLHLREKTYPFYYEIRQINHGNIWQKLLL